MFSCSFPANICFNGFLFCLAAVLRHTFERNCGLTLVICLFKTVEIKKEII